MKKKRKDSGRGKRKHRTAPPYPTELKVRIARLLLEEVYPVALLAQEFGVSGYSVYRWARLYRQHGEQGLKPKIRSASKSGLPAEVKEKIVDLKRAHSSFGTRRISDVLKRFFLMRTSSDHR